MDNSDSGELYKLYFDPRSAPVVFRQPQFMTNTYKIALLGARGVGKTAIFNRLCYDLFEEEAAQLHDAPCSSVTTSQSSSISSSHSGGESAQPEDVMQRSLEEPSIVREVLTLTLVDGTRMTVEVIDVHGAPPMTSVLSLKDCSAIAMIYSVEDAQSWKYIEQQLMSQLKHACPPDCDLLFLGNKCDTLISEDKDGQACDQRLTIVIGHVQTTTRARAVPLQRIDAYATSHGISLWECSAKNGHNVRDAFAELVQKLREKMPIGDYEESEELDGVDGKYWYEQSGARVNNRKYSFKNTQQQSSHTSSWCLFKCW